MIKKIVLTGEPGSGKTTVTEGIVSHFTKKGVKVIVIPETATDVINSGIKSFGEDPIDVVDFQELIMRMQLAKEDIYDRAASMYAKKYPNRDILLIYDRGMIDNCAYIDKEGFVEVLNRLNHVNNFATLLKKYDAIIDLIGRKDFYTLENNAARSESYEKAHALGKETLRNWLGHKNIHIVFPKDKKEEKLREVIQIVENVLNKQNIKKQKKYLLDLSRSDLSQIDSLDKESMIEQSYLISDAHVEKRLRKVTYEGCVTYEFSIFRINAKGEKELLSEKEIDEEMYRQLLEFQDPSTKTIVKRRRYFYQGDAYLYIDIFPENTIGILEYNVVSGKTEQIPPYLAVLSDVSNDPNYSNREMAKKEHSSKMVITL